MRIYLLEILIENGIIKLFKNIQVEFHDFVITGAEVCIKKFKMNFLNPFSHLSV